MSQQGFSHDLLIKSIFSHLQLSHLPTIFHRASISIFLAHFIQNVLCKLFINLHTFFSKMVAKTLAVQNNGKMQVAALRHRQVQEREDLCIQPSPIYQQQWFSFFKCPFLQMECLSFSLSKCLLDSSYSIERTQFSLDTWGKPERKDLGLVVNVLFLSGF